MTPYRGVEWGFCRGVLSKINAHRALPAVKSELFVERNHAFRTIQNDFVAVESAAFVEQMVDKRPPHAMLLKSGVNGNVLNMSHDTAGMNEFWFDEDRGRSRDPSLDQCDVRPDTRAQAIAVNTDGLISGQFGRPESTDRFEKPSIKVRRVH